MAQKTEEAVITKLSIRLPKMYTVIMHDDPITTMDFVVWVLMKVFDKTSVEAARLMTLVHETGKGIVGVYTYDIAVTKKMQTMQYASEKGFPLTVSIEEEESDETR